jgi:hypothetical protein
MLIRVSCNACGFVCLWTDDPQGFLREVCLEPDGCQARLAARLKSTRVGSIQRWAKATHRTVRIRLKSGRPQTLLCDQPELVDEVGPARSRVVSDVDPIETRSRRVELAHRNGHVRPLVRRDRPEDDLRKCGLRVVLEPDGDLEARARREDLEIDGLVAGWIE